MTERRVKNTTSLVAPRPGDRLDVSTVVAFEQNGNIIGQARILVEAAHGLKGLNSGENGMLPCRGGKLRVGAGSHSIVSLVVSAQNFLVEIEPSLDCMAGGADADN